MKAKSAEVLCVLKMEKIIRIREERCTGCRVCEMICSLEKEGIFNPRKSRIKVFQDRAKGLDIPSICQLCDPAPCVDACPVDALRKDMNVGTIVPDTETCIGEECLKCITECPYGAISWGALDKKLILCDLCGGDPECAKFCHPRAIIYEECSPEEIQKQRKNIEQFLRPVLTLS